MGSDRDIRGWTWSTPQLLNLLGKRSSVPCATYTRVGPSAQRHLTTSTYQPNCRGVCAAAGSQLSALRSKVGLLREEVGLQLGAALKDNAAAVEGLHHK